MLSSAWFLLCVALPSKKTVIEAQLKKKKSSIEFSMLVLNTGDFKQHVGEVAYFTVEQLTHENPNYDR